MKEVTRYIFVGGCGRSGTTLVQKILCGHSEISGGPELGFTRDFFELFSRVQEIYGQGLLSEYYDAPIDFEDSFRSFLGSLLKNKEQSGIKFISEKTPSNIFVAKPILALFKSAIFINVVRDGRDVIASHLKVKKRYKAKGKHSGISIKSTCRLWNNSICAYQSSNESLEFSERIFSVKYEELVLNPQKVLENLFAFLKLDFEQHLLNPEDLETKKVVNVNDIWYTKEMARQPFNSSSIGNWKKMSLWKKVRTQILIARNLKEMGYSVKTIYLMMNSILSVFQIRNLRRWGLYKIYLKFRLRYT